MKMFKTLGLFFYQTIDKNGFLYVSLKSLNIYIRYLFYITLIISAFLVTSYLTSLLDSNAYYESMSVFFMIIITLYISLIICYESLYTSDVESIVKKIKERQHLIKKNKQQWWRFRNMNMFYRFMIYITIYFILQQTLIINTLLLLHTASFSKVEYELALNEFRQIIHYFTFSYILIILIFDYFVNKKRKHQLNLKESKNEN